MASGQLNTVLRRIRQLVSSRDAADQTDGQLLEDFALCRKEAAFAALLQRYGPVVLGVCRRVLHDPHDVEDAFQATFLVLVRKAGMLRKQGSLGGWLYTVAFHAALKMKAQAARRREIERHVPAMSEVSPEEGPWNELQPLLDEELNRLPEKYRVPLVLCYLEGKTNEQAAKQLGWPKGTVQGRLARARDLLRARLVRQGVVLTEGALTALLVVEKATATVPVALAESTSKAALLFAAGKTAAVGAASFQAVAVAEGMLRAALAARLKLAALVLLVASALSAGTGIVIHRALADRAPVLDEDRELAHRPPPVLERPGDPECNEHQRRNEGGTLIASPEAFATLVKPDCSHCRDEARRRAAELRDEDRVLCWVRGDYDGGAIPFRFFLNTHRVISDKYGVFVYDPDAGYARGFAPSLEFRFHGWRNGIMVMQHKDGTLYSCLSGIAFEGPGKGSRLQPVPTLVSAWGFWLQRYPGSLAYRMDPQFQPVDLPTSVHKDSCHSRARPDKRLPISTPVLGVVESMHARAYPLDLLAEAGLIRDTVDGRSRVLLWDQVTRTAVAYRPLASPPRTDPAPPRPLTIELAPKGAAAPFTDTETGSRWDIAGRAVEGDLKGWTLAWLDGVQVKWFAWAAEYPETSVFGK